MIFSKLAIALISPLGTSLLLGMLALVLGGLGRRRVALGFGLFALLWLWVWSLPFASIGLRAALEGDYPPQQISDFSAAPAMVVLGGSIVPPSFKVASANLTDAADRIRFAAQLYHAGKAPLVVLTGGSDLDISLTSEAEAMRLLLRELGVPHSAMVLEEASRTTHENAQFTALLLRERGISQVLLVTSALHMRRAVAHFESAGIQVLPAATDHEARAVASWQKWLPDAGALDGSGRAMKEWVGCLLKC